MALTRAMVGKFLTYPITIDKYQALQFQSTSDEQIQCLLCAILEHLERMNEPSMSDGILNAKYLLLGRVDIDKLGALRGALNLRYHAINDRKYKYVDEVLPFDVDCWVRGDSTRKTIKAFIKSEKRKWLRKRRKQRGV